LIRARLSQRCCWSAAWASRCAHADISRTEAAPLPLTVDADEAFYSNIIQNLVRVRAQRSCSLASVAHSARAFASHQVTNAVRFEDGKEVTVSVTCTAGVQPGGDSCGEADGAPGARAAGEGDANTTATHTLHATVTDHGRGLTAQEQERMWLAYEAAPSCSGGGTGLGLFVSRACARRAGATSAW
jgi:hypothetical protein